MKNNILWGVVLIIVGVIFGLNALDITDINIFFDGWWTLFIIVPCFINLFKNEDKIGEITGLVIGMVLLLACQGVISFSIILKLLVPFIIVMIGLSLIFKDVTFKKKSKKIVGDKSLNVCCSTFSNQKVDYTNEEFNGCEFTAVFGGIECDLRNATIKEDVVINATTVFGGIDILVPKNVNVKVVSTPVFGGVDSDKHKNSKNNTITIFVNATCVFGGVDIKWVKLKKL